MKHQATKPRGIVRSMVAALVVAIGTAIVWGTVVMWGAGIVESWTRTGITVYEQVTVTQDGIPVIQSYSVSDYETVTYRTLEGEPIEVGNREVLLSAYLNKATLLPRFFSLPLGWGQSLSASDFSRPRGSWYLVRDNQPNGHAYFVGYDAISKMPIGYLARSGFRRGLPSVDEWFDVGLSEAYWRGAASTQSLQFNSPTNHYEPGTVRNNLPGWLVFVIDGDRLQEVNLRERTVREVFTAPQLVSVGVLRESTPPPGEGEQARMDDEMNSRVAVLTQDHIFVLDPQTDAKREFPLAESLPDESFSAYLIGPDRLLLHWTTYDDYSGQTQHLVWLGADGQVDRTADFQLANSGGGQENPYTAALVAAGVAPIPVGWGAVVGVVAPVSMLNWHDEPTYAAAVKKILAMAWPGMVIVMMIGLASAWIVWRWQRKYYRSATPGWCAFAFLLGLPGVIAYWLQMRRAKLEPCGECQTIVPRDRDACAACASPFAVPPLVGTEIFA